MISFTCHDFEEADKKLENLYKERADLEKLVRATNKSIEIAEEERNFIGNWLMRNGATKEEIEKIENVINPIAF